MKTLYHGSRNKTIEMLQEELFFNEVYILVYGEYKTAHDPVDCECLICGYAWSVIPNSLLTNKGCKNCTGTLTLTLDQYRETLLELGKDFVLTGEYKNQLSRITCHCNNCGHTRTVSAAALRKGGCPGCSQKVKYTIETLQAKLDKNNREIVVLSTEYKAIKEPLVFQCLKCNYQWTALPSSLINHWTGCSECSRTGLKYTLPCNLYYLRLTNKANEVVYKIGISGKTALQRYHAEGDVQIEVLYEFKFETGKEAYQAERNILKLYKDYLYSGDKILNYTGISEMFRCDVLQLGHLEPRGIKNAQ